MLATSFTDAALTKQGAWVGLDNDGFFSDRGFAAALRNSLHFVALTVVPGTLVGRALAMVVNRLRGYLLAIALSMFCVPHILLLAGLRAIPQSLYEAAQLDGAGHGTEMMNVTVNIAQIRSYGVSGLAAALMAGLPVVMIYLLSQRRVTEAVTLAVGVKDEA